MGKAASSGTAGASFAVLIHSPSSSMQREVCHDGSRSTTLDCPIMIMMHRTKQRGRGRVKMKEEKEDQHQDQGAGCGHYLRWQGMYDMAQLHAIL